MVAEDLPLEGECVIDGTGNLLFDCIPVDYRPLFERLPQTALKSKSVTASDGLSPNRNVKIGLYQNCICKLLLSIDRNLYNAC